MKKVWIGIGLVVLAIAWYAFRPELLFINTSVSESFPVASVAATAPDAGSDPKQLAMGQFKGYAHETQGNADVYEVNGKRVLRLTNFKTSNGPDVHVYLVAAPDAKDDATVKRAGFIDLGSMKGNMGDQNYDVPNTAARGLVARLGSKGTIFVQTGARVSGLTLRPEEQTLYDAVDGRRVLRLTNFKTSNGPDVHVYLVAAPDAKDDATVKKAGFVDLGSMKGNTGDQNYDVPATVDLATYQAVTIWCARFNVNFGTAPLMASN